MEIKRIGLLLAKIESSYATDPTPTAALNTIPAVADTVTFNVNSDPVARMIMDGGLGKVAGFPAALPSIEMRFRTELRGNKSTLTDYAAQAVVCEADDETVTLASHTLRNGDLVSFGGTPPTGITGGTYYYVINVTTNTFQVSATYGGSAVNMTTDGSNVTITSIRPDVTAGSSNFAHDWDCLLKACHLTPTYTAEASTGARDGYVIYKPYEPTAEGPSVTFWFYTHLKLHKITGCKGTFQAVWEAGKMVAIDWTFRGLYNAPTDATFPTTQAWLSTKPPLFAASTTTLGSYTPVFSRLNLNLGNRIDRRLSAVATDGIAGFLITGRETTGDIDPESVAEATHPIWANWKANTIKTLSCLTGSTAGNKFLLTLVTQLREANLATRDNHHIHNAPFDVCREYLGDTLGSELQLKFF